MATKARETALMILERCRRSQAFSDALFGSAVSSAGLSQKDSALCAKLCYGVLQNSALCDYYIDHYANGSGKIEPKVRDILRLSVYQILFLTKIPPHAAVSEGVELCKSAGYLRATGFVNALLRKISAERERLPELPKGDLAEYLSIKYSTPRELTELLISEHGGEYTEAFLKASNTEPPVAVQVNTLKTTAEELIGALSAEGVGASLHPFLRDCLVIDEAGDISVTEAFKNGLFYVQDAAARMAVTAAAPKSGMRVLDCCAAPGGKSFAAALEMQNEGEIISCDLHDNKLSRIDSGAKRLGLSCIKTHVIDASHPDRAFAGAFDLVIADVPCSGLGVIRKKPDIRYKKLAELEALPEVQYAIIDAIAACVKPGGVLLYSTCTILRRENDAIVRAFLLRHSEFEAESFTLPEPVGEVSDGILSLDPQTHGTDGFFIAKLRRRNEG